MKEDKKYVRKSFWVHQYEKEEAFLSQMAKEGWHFVRLHMGIPTKYEFVKGEKIDYVYQLDFVTPSEDTEDYHQLFADAGWDEVFSWMGVGGKWYYFRRVHTDGQNERIYSDSESKYQMYDKLWKKFGLYFILLLLLELNGINAGINILKEVGLASIGGAFMLVLMCLLVVVSLLLGYWVIALILERNKIKHRLTSGL